MLFKLGIILLTCPFSPEIVTANITSAKATNWSEKNQGTLCWLRVSVFLLQDGSKLLAFPKMTGRNVAPSLGFIIQNPVHNGSQMSH